MLKHTIKQGWPSTIKEVPSVLQSYWIFREELMIEIEDGIILKGTRIVIPAKKCEAVLKHIHEVHLGLKKWKLHAKETVYWPGLNDQLEKLIVNCELCLKYSQSKCKQKPNMSLGQEIPLHPWSQLPTDIFHFEGASYLLIVDYTSRFPVVCTLPSMTGQHVATQCKLSFSEYGWPETLISDNGPCYTVETFTNEMNSYHVNHIISSPNYPQSNRLAEKYVQIVKNLFTRQKKRVKIYSNAWWSTTIHLLVVACSHWCKSCRVGAQDLTYPCLMQVYNSLVYNLNSLEMLTRMTICLHMIYILGKRSYIKMLQASSGIQPLLPAYACSQEVITLQGKVSPTGRHKLIWSPTNHKARSQHVKGQNVWLY